jgi:hypothetical protein
LRLNLTSEHLDRTGPANDLLDPATTFRDCATHLQRWYDGGCQGAQPLTEVSVAVLAPRLTEDRLDPR